MKREILFRGKTFGGEWVYGFYQVINHPSRDYHQIAGREVDGNSICQFTGLFDMEGNQIFEGDIVKLGMWNTEKSISPITGKSNWELSCVFYDSGRFVFAGYDHVDMDYYRNVIVMENIFDSPQTREIIRPKSKKFDLLCHSIFTTS